MANELSPQFDRRIIEEDVKNEQITTGKQNERHFESDRAISSVEESQSTPLLGNQQSQRMVDLRLTETESNLNDTGQKVASDSSDLTQKNHVNNRLNLLTSMSSSSDGVIESHFV